jgi:microcystin-dependent protein
MSDPFLGEIKMFAGNFAPRGHAFANGQVLPIAQYTALFSLFGTSFGGDGKTTFGIPDLQGRVPMAAGEGGGLTTRRVGDRGGSVAVTLTADQLPSHTHPMVGEDEEASTSVAGGNALGVNPSVNWYKTPIPPPNFHPTPMSTQAVGSAGGGQPHNNLQPYLAISFIVAVQGIYPPRS